MKIPDPKIIASLLIFIAPFTYAEDPDQRDAYAFYLENDSRNIGGPGSDQAYSNGMKFSYIYAQGKTPKWAVPTLDRFKILENRAKYSKINFGISLGHQMYTPSNKSEIELVEDDRPYAAWLYLGFAASLKEKTTEQFVEVDIGTVGPSALGKEVQNNFHQLIGVADAKGWKNGIKNEPTLQLFYQKRFKIVLSKNLEFIPFYGAGLGNVLVGGHLGGMIRIGSHMPDDFGTSRPSASDGNSFISATSSTKNERYGYYFFGTARGNFVERNIFLDGNTTQDSHRVKKIPLTFETEFGAALHLSYGAIVWRFVTKSPEYEEKKELNSFASVSFVFVP